jgi:hypothetical protein
MSWHFTRTAHIAGISAIMRDCNTNIENASISQVFPGVPLSKPALQRSGDFCIFGILDEITCVFKLMTVYQYHTTSSSALAFQF